MSPLTDPWSQASEALRPRDLRGDDGAALCLDTVDEPLRRWGSQTGGLGGWRSGGEGRHVCLRLVTTKSASSESGGEELRDLLQRGLQRPVTITTDGAAGLRKAVDRLGLRARRLRCGWPKRPTLLQQVPPPAGPACTALGAALRDAPRCEEGQRRFQTLRAQSQGTLPAACRGLEDDAEARLNH
jgi:transposase-like protein